MKFILGLALIFSVMFNFGQYEVYKESEASHAQILKQVITDRAQWCQRNN